jgi:hypothetical protein
MFYPDITSMYPTAALEPVPVGDYTFEKASKFTKTNILKLDGSNKAKRGYILEVDLRYPKHLHKYFSDLPPTPVHKEIKYEDLSPYSKEVLKIQKRAFKPEVKLVSSLEDLHNYCVHFRLLQFLLLHGVELVKVHKVLSFKQDLVFKNFINKTSEARKDADEKGDKIGKTIHKLRSNSSIGKTMENVENRVNVKIVDKEKYPRFLYRNHTRIREVFNFIEEEKNTDSDDVKCLEQLGHFGVVLPKYRTKLTSPKQIAFAILDNAKLLLYKFHYDVMKVHYPGHRSKLIYTDTDSLLYEVDEPTVNNVYTKLKDHMDLSNLPKDHECYDETNRMKMGFMKCAMEGERIYSAICLAPKTYMVNNIKKAKGIMKACLDNDIDVEDYKEALHTSKAKTVTQTSIRSDKKHIVTTEEFEKLALSSFDDKRYHINHLKSYPYGHYKIKKFEEEQKEKAKK